MTQHLQVSAHPDHLGRYLTACGKQLRAEHISGPAGVTCRACKNTDAWREAT